MLGLAVLSAVLYLWNLTSSGFANSYYSAAALAASQSWSAWFFGSLDAGNFITVDKPPLATMLMGLSVRLFGLSSAGILVPEALLGVGSVVLLFVIVRRQFGVPAGTVAGLAFAVTPVAALMFRYNHPDALLTFLMLASAYGVQRAIENGRHRWLALAGIALGLAFLTKYLQGFLVGPALALAYVVAANSSLRRRVAGIVVMAAATFATAAAWVAAVTLTPADLRPFIGGSTNNSVLDLIFGYDGLGRIFGAAAGAAGVRGGQGGANFSGTPGVLRLFNSEFGGQIAWILPAAVLALIGGLWLTRHAPRTDVRRAGYLLWGSWIFIHAVVFSFMSGIVHSYYAVAIAPAIAALLGAGVAALWQHRERFVARAAAAAAVACHGRSRRAFAVAQSNIRALACPAHRRAGHCRRGDPPGSGGTRIAGGPGECRARTGGHARRPDGLHARYGHDLLQRLDRFGRSDRHGNRLLERITKWWLWRARSRLRQRRTRQLQWRRTASGRSRRRPQRGRLTDQHGPCRIPDGQQRQCDLDRRRQRRPGSGPARAPDGLACDGHGRLVRFRPSIDR